MCNVICNNGIRTYISTIIPVYIHNSDLGTIVNLVIIKCEISATITPTFYDLIRYQYQIHRVTIYLVAFLSSNRAMVNIDNYVQSSSICIMCEYDSHLQNVDH